MAKRLGGKMTRALGRMVGLLLALYVFDQVIDTLYTAGINDSTYFSTAVTFIDSLFPIIGILGAFEIIYTSLQAAQLL